MLVIVLLTEHTIIVINTHSYIEIGNFILYISIGVLVSQIPNMSKQLKRSSNQIAFNNVQLNFKKDSTMENLTNAYHTCLNW